MESVRPEPYCVGSLQISQFQWLFKCQRWFYYKFKKVMINGETLAHTTTAVDKLKIGDYKMLQKWIVFKKNYYILKYFWTGYYAIGQFGLNIKINWFLL